MLVTPQGQFRLPIGLVTKKPWQGSRLSHPRNVCQGFGFCIELDVTMASVSPLLAVSNRRIAHFEQCYDSGRTCRTDFWPRPAAIAGKALSGGCLPPDSQP